MKSPPLPLVRLHPAIEPLESRIAPAAVFTYTDVDRDTVTVKTSKGTNADLAGILVFDDPNPANPRQLQEIDFSAAVAIFTGTDLSITARRTAAGGDGYVNVGEIDAADFDGGTALDLGRVSINGDLGRIWVGDSDAATGLKSLTLQSLGEAGTFTQSAGGIIPASLTSTVTGRLGSLKIIGSIVGAKIGALHDIGSITIGGSIFGAADSGSGSIVAGGKIGVVKIVGGLVGGDGDDSGRIATSESIASITIGGAIEGGAGMGSGLVFADKIGIVKIGAAILGGGGAESGRIQCLGDIAGVSVGGSIVGGDGDTSGSIIGARIGSLRIGDDLRGDAVNSGSVFAFSIGNVSIGGSILSSVSDYSGQIRVVGSGIASVNVGGDLRKDGTGMGGGLLVDSGSIGEVTIRGGVVGPTGVGGGLGSKLGPIFIAGSLDGGFVVAPTVTRVTLGGSLIGGTTGNSGAIIGVNSLGPVKIRGDIVGGTADFAGTVGSGDNLATVFVGGSVIGGTAPNTGAIHATGDAGAIVVRGDLRGGSGTESGRIDMVNAPSVFIGGSVIGGTADDTGQIEASGTIRVLKIGGDLRNGPRPLAGTINRTGYISADSLPSVTIGGSIVVDFDTGPGGIVADSASIHAAHHIGSLTILGSILGQSSQSVVITASGQSTPGAGTDVAIGSLTVKGRVERAKILAGFDINGVPDNADAQIGKVVVRDWIASNLAAGVSTGTDSFFGDPNDALITVSDDAALKSRIGSIVITGQVAGTASPGDLATFGFIAQQIGSLKIGATAIPLTPGAGNDTFGTGTAVPLGATKGIFLADGFDFHAYEV